MKLAFLYAGQGSQTPGMGADLYEEYPSVRPVFDIPKEVLGFDLKETCFSAPAETLSRTRYTQPCMVAFAAAVTRIFREAGIRPDYAAGLSLGEYSALCCAGVFTPEEAVALTAFRGRAMEEASDRSPGGLTALLGIGVEAAKQACCQAAKETGGVAEIANLNCAGQVVIGGTTAALDRAAAIAKEMGAKKAVPLRVSGPFHTSLMAPAGAALERRFVNTAFRPMELPVVFNATARPMAEEETVPGLLVRQVQSLTLFGETIRWLLDAGVDTAVEIGPGKALSGLVKKSGPLPESFRLLQAESAESVRQAIDTLKE